MKVDRLHQISFVGGMQENLKQNLYQNNHIIQSALWIENFNPNLEYRSLVKRHGVTIYNTDYTLGNLDAIVGVGKVTNDIDKVFGGFKLNVVNPNDHLMQLLMTHRLTTGQNNNNNPHVIIGGAYEATAILNNYKDTWMEAFADGVTYPGWYVMGSYNHHDRYGERVYFVTHITKPELINNNNYAIVGEFLYPVYEYFYWNLTKKREHDNLYWNGLSNDFTADDYKLWKVKTPSMILKDNVGLLHKTKGETTWTGTSKGIDILIQETKLNNGNKNHRCTTRLVDYTNSANRDYRLDSLSDFPDNISTNTNYIRNGNVAVSPSQTLEDVSYPYLYSFEQPKYNKVREIIDSANNLGTELLTKNYYINNIDLRTVSIKGIKEAAGSSSEDDNHFEYCLVFELPDYISAKAPRPWIKKEKIPLLLTANYKGAEVVIWQDNYEIQTDTDESSILNYDSSALYSNALSIFAGAVKYIEETEAYPMGDVQRKYYTEIWNNAVYSLDKKIKEIRTGVATTTMEPVWIAPLMSRSIEDSFFTIENRGLTTIALHKNYNILNFTIRLDDETFRTLLELDVSSLKLYISGPDGESYYRSIGTSSYSPVPLGLFEGPAINENNKDQYDNYRLLKEFVIDGKGAPRISSLGDLEDDYSDYYGTPVATNGWQLQTDGRYYAVPQLQDDSTIDDAELDITVNSNIEEQYSPDFTIYDYGFDAPPLNLQGSGKYWEGKGAKLIQIIKGRTFIAGCIDYDGKEEPAILRYSTMQRAAHLNDVFYEEDKMQVGHLPITAMIQFREQLLVFNRETSYRSMLPIISDITSWEHLETIHGQGTFAQKTTTETPYGVAFCNESGIWITDGGMPKAITDNDARSVRGIYQLLMLGRRYDYEHTYREIATADIMIESDWDYNHRAELVYDSLNDEVALITPIYGHTVVLNYPQLDKEIRLIYNFKAQNWRVESMQLPDDDSGNTQFVKVHGLTTGGRYHFSSPGIMQIRSSFNAGNASVDYGYEDEQVSTDEFQHTATGTIEQEIIGNLITHEIGDGKNDYILRGMILECSSTSSNYAYDEATNDDPIVAIELRNRQSYEAEMPLYLGWQRLDPNPNGDTKPNYTIEDDGGWLDLIKINMRAKQGTPNTGNLNPFNSLMQTPGFINTNHLGVNHTNYDSPTSSMGRESLNIVAPINTTFRQMRFMINSKYIYKIRSMIYQVTQKQRF